MRGLEELQAKDVLALAVERHHPRLVMACSFQKEESVLIDMLMSIEPSARVFTIDTGALFPETYEVWRRIEGRYGLHIEVMEATAYRNDVTGGWRLALRIRRQDDKKTGELRAFLRTGSATLSETWSYVLPIN